MRLRARAWTCPEGWCPGPRSTSAASHSALDAGQSMRFCAFYLRTISPFGEPKSILCTCFFIYSQKEEKKLHFNCSFSALISRHFPCLCLCGNVHLWERIIYFNVFCSCLVGPLLKPYGPPRAEKLGWKTQRDSLVQIQCHLFEVLGASTAARSN